MSRWILAAYAALRRLSSNMRVLAWLAGAFTSSDGGGKAGCNWVVLRQTSRPFSGRKLGSSKKTVQETPGLARQMGTESCIIHQLGKVHFLSLLVECTEERFGKKFLNEWEPYSVSPGSLCCFIALRLRAWKGIIYPRDSSKWKG